jgi:hypothetical protein
MSHGKPGTHLVIVNKPDAYHNDTINRLTTPLHLLFIVVFQDPHVIIYGGTTDTGANYTNAQGSKSVWVWNSQNGTWYDAQTLSSGTNGFSPQVFFRAVTLPSSGQSLFIASNTSGGGALLQKLDSTVWSWNSPTSTSKLSTFFP